MEKDFSTIKNNKLYMYILYFFIFAILILVKNFWIVNFLFIFLRFSKMGVITII